MGGMPLLSVKGEMNTPYIIGYSLTKNTVTAVRYEQRSRWSEVGAGSCAEDQAAWR